MADENVTLTVRGKTYEGWKSIRITKSMKAIAASFSLTLTDNWNYVGAAWILVPGDECEVKTNGETVLKGYIDSVESSYSANDHTLTVTGREKTGDLVDCSVDYKGQTDIPNISLYALAQKLAGPFGVQVKNESGVFKPIEKVSISPGDTVHNVLEKYARHEGVLLSSDGLGTLILQSVPAVDTGASLGGALTAAASGGLNALAASLGIAPAGFIEGKNILSASSTYTHKDRFSEYRVVAQTNVPGIEQGQATKVVGKAVDQEVQRKRLLVVNAENAMTPDRATARAKWELSHRRGTSMQVSIKVQGWRLADKSLLKPNKLYKVDSPLLGVEEELLLEEVSFSIAESGSTAELKLTRQDAFKPEPQPKGSYNPWEKLVKDNSILPFKLP